MFIRTNYFPDVVLYTLLVTVTSLASAATIRGRICDDGKRPPDDGIPTAKVTVRAATGMTFESTSNANGIYEIPDVPNGEVVIIIEKDGYARKPTELKEQVTDKAHEIRPVYMWQPGATEEAYFIVVARNMLARTEEQDDKSRALAAEWIYLTAARVPVTFKWRLAGALVELDGSTRKALPVLAQYQSVELDTVVRLQATCRRAMEQPNTHESLAELQKFVRQENIPRGLYADAVIETLNLPRVTAVQRQRVIERQGAMDILDDSARDSLRVWAKRPKIDRPVHASEPRSGYQKLIEEYTREG